MQKHSYKMRIFQCPDCGTLMYAGKSSARMTAKGHVKSLWCHKCHKVRQMIQVDSYDVKSK